MKKTKSVLEKKRGSALIMILAITMIGVVFFGLIVDIGSAYASRVQLQHISDAACLAGADSGKYAYYSVADKKAVAVIKEGSAISAATSIINKNKGFLPNSTKIDSIKLNPWDSVLGSALEQFYSGSFTVKLESNSKTFMQDIGAIKHKNASTTQVKPK